MVQQICDSGVDLLRIDQVIVVEYQHNFIGRRAEFIEHCLEHRFTRRLRRLQHCHCVRPIMARLRDTVTKRRPLS